MCIEYWQDDPESRPDIQSVEMRLKRMFSNLNAVYNEECTMDSINGRQINKDNSSFSNSCAINPWRCSPYIWIEIFKFTRYPASLARTNKLWSNIAKDPYARCYWLLYHYGKAHALFYAVRLGHTYIDIPVCQNLLAIKVILLRYFIQIFF